MCISISSRDADFSVAMTLPYAEEAQLPLDYFANLRCWHDRLNEIEGWREPFPARDTSAATTCCTVADSS
jgi:glutathione S-transferase